MCSSLLELSVELCARSVAIDCRRISAHAQKFILIVGGIVCVSSNS